MTQKEQSFFHLLRSHPKVLAFGFLTATLSGFGQTYYISAFYNEFISKFALKASELSSIYAIVTLLSASVLIWAGAKIDQISIKKFITVAMVGLSLGGLLMALADSIWLFTIAMFLLRISGQGLLSHISSTCTIRWFNVSRGKALVISNLGFTVSETLFPSLAGFNIQSFQWEGLWLGHFLIGTLLLLPILLWLISEKNATSFLSEELVEMPTSARSSEKIFTLIMDSRFLFLMPVATCVNLILTAIFWIQIPLSVELGLSQKVLAASFGAFALSSFLGSFFVGKMIDRRGTISLLRFFLVPLLLALVLFSTGQQFYQILAAMTFMGLTAGANRIVFSAIWAELYGIKNVGQVRALHGAFAIFSTAISPLICGFFLDTKTAPSNLLKGFGVYLVLNIILSMFYYRKFVKEI